jgi:hypothetical protein
MTVECHQKRYTPRSRDSTIQGTIFDALICMGQLLAGQICGSHEFMVLMWVPGFADDLLTRIRASQGPGQGRIFRSIYMLIGKP